MKLFAKFHSKIINIFIHNLNIKFFLIIYYTLILFTIMFIKQNILYFLYQIKCVSLPCVNKQLIICIYKICRNLIFEASVVIYLTNPKNYMS